jgi:hypothetical protein
MLESSNVLSTKEITKPFANHFFSTVTECVEPLLVNLDEATVSV